MSPYHPARPALAPCVGTPCSPAFARGVCLPAQAYLGLETAKVEEGVRLSAKVQHASQVVVMPIESYVTPPSPSPMLEAV